VREVENTWAASCSGAERYRKEIRTAHSSAHCPASVASSNQRFAILDIFPRREPVHRPLPQIIPGCSFLRQRQLSEKKSGRHTTPASSQALAGVLLLNLRQISHGMSLLESGIGVEKQRRKTLELPFAVTCWEVTKGGYSYTKKLCCTYSLCSSQPMAAVMLVSPRGSLIYSSSTL
jgi:hypothetical protein